ncbi:MAG: carboxylesterase family protein [Lachnospiraceae bacterium]|nr:carboxylesterase family protein [Lachnospiraceae bacterium]
MKKKVMSVILVIFGLLYFCYLEVFKNQIFGWVIAILLFAGFIFLRKKYFGDWKFGKRCIALVCLVALLVCNGYISAPKEEQVKAYSWKNVSYTDEVQVNEGTLQGIYSEDSEAKIFAGIPYAKAPVGELRWKEPQPAENWDGVRVCDTFAPMAMQKRSDPIYAFGSRIVGYNEIPVAFGENYLEAMSEDCLYLNVWAPSDAKAGDDLPVLFYIHGGSLNSGQSYYEDYNGESYAKQGIVFVSISYRVGVFGYLADDELAAESPNGTTGNYGLLDQIAALQWVNDNIESFGGNAKNITIAGESAGSSSVNALCVSPLAKGLFVRAIAESSGITPKVPYHTFRTLDAAKEVAANIKDEFNCDTIEELREVPAEELVNNSYQNNEMTVDGYAITEQPYLTYLAGNNNEETVLGGYNGEEAIAFLLFDDVPTVDNYAEFLEPIAGDFSEELASLRPVTTDEEAKANYHDLVGMAWFGYSHYAWSELMKNNDQTAYLYYFNKTNKSLSDWHAGELPYFYGNLKHNNNYEESDYELSQTIQNYILNYVKTGNPNGEGLPEWKSYNEAPTEVMNFGEKTQMIENDYLDVFKVFEKYVDSISD